MYWSSTANFEAYKPDEKHLPVYTGHT